MDKAGNYSAENSSKIRIDKTSPQCSSSGGDGAWTNSGRYLVGTCADQGSFQSGCTGNASSMIDYEINRTDLSPGTVYDNAGNSAPCPANQTVRVDKTPPACTSSGGDGAWTNDGRNLVGTCADQGGYQSGCTGNASWLINWEGDWTNLSPGTVYDYAGNSTPCPANQTVRVDKTPPSCTVRDNTPSGGSRQDGLEYRVSCSDSFGELSKCDGRNANHSDYENQKEGKSFEVSDKAGNTNTCSVKIKKQYKAATCHSCNRCPSADCETYSSCCQKFEDVTTCSAFIGSKCSKTGKEPGYSCTASGGTGTGQTCYSGGFNYYCEQCRTDKNVCTGGYARTSKCSCETRKQNCPKCGCGSWNSYPSDWSDTNSCKKADRENNNCQRKVRWVIDNS